jgi:hypothetical protein
MLSRFEVPVLALVENMASFRCGACGEAHFPFGRGGVEAVLDAIHGAADDERDDDSRCQERLPCVHLPIAPTRPDSVDPHDVVAPVVAESAAAEYAELAAVLETRMANESSVSTTVELPQLAWHERPNWPNKL